MSQKVFKKGEFLYKDGDKIQAVYLIQSGGVNQCLVRGKKTIDLFQLSTGQILGEQVLLGQNTFNTSAVATAETKVLEIPLESLKQIYDGSPQMIKALIKSLAERLRLSSNEVRSTRLEKDSSPCPEELVAKVFASIFFTAKHKGDTKSFPGRTVVDWNLFKQYAQRVLGESPKRLEQATNILVKMGQALFEMGKNPDNPEGPEEIQKVHILDLSVVETFFEFYQYYYFKNKTDLLKVDELCYQILIGLVKNTEKETPDRFGIVELEFNKLADYCKEELGINLNNDHFTRLETKGILMKRKSTPQGVVLQFEQKEYHYTLQAWKIIREIDKWNEKGFVDINEKEEKPKKKTGGPTCPACEAEIAPAAKFCHECGHKLTAAA
ncbi:MAG: cyclic nucleotide-binding domain-containing protein [Bdellovibrionia bacterium]